MPPRDIRTELRTGTEWTDVSADPLTRQPVVIERGRADEASAITPSKGTLSLKNRSGEWSPRNPRSPRFGQIGRNTPLRVSVPGATTYLGLTGDPADTATTPDHTSLDIVGDLDLRVEISGNRFGAPTTRNLIGKWEESGNLSFLLQISTDGQLRLRWSSDGASTGGRSWALSLPGGLPRRVALRAALDVDNGAGGHIVRMYWATSLAGPWAQFGAEFPAIAGTTGVYAGTAPLSIAPISPSSSTPSTPLDGQVYAAEVRNSSGTVVANPSFTAQPLGTTSFADSAGRTWTLAGAATITNRRYRLHGEVPSWAPRWDLSGQDVETPIEVAGITRRLGQGQKPLASALRRSIPSAPGLLAYWPMEDAREATQAYSPIDGVKPMRVSGLEFAAVDTLVSSAPLPTLKVPSSISGAVPPPPSGSTAWSVSWLYRLDTAPASERTYMGLTSTGTVRKWAFAFAASISRIVGYDGDNNEVVNQPIGTGSDLFGQWVQVTFRVRQSGTSVEWRIDWRDVGGDAGGFGTTYTGTVGRCTGVISPSAGFHTDLDGMGLGHIGVFALYEPTGYSGAVTGYAGESVLNRLYRLSAEERALPISWIDGDPARQSTLVGPQRPDTLLTLLQEAADADAGILYETRDALALTYRDRTTLYNQEPALVLDYTAGGEVALGLEPTDDDQALRNDRTVSRLGGSSARVVIEEGPLSVQAPPDGVGVYDDTVTLNVFSDAQTEPMAAWRAHLGTVDEARYPSVHVNLAAGPHLTEQVLAADIGDLIRIVNLPQWLPPGPVDLIVQGYQEVIDQYAWDITFTCTPAAPWEVGVRDDETRGRRDTAGAVLAVAIDETDTSALVHTTVGPYWTQTAGDFPFDVVLGGERATASAIGPGAADTFNRTVAAGGWGTSSSGLAWVQAGGTGTDRAVNGTRGTINLPANVSTLRLQQLLGEAIGDCDVQVRLSVSAVATGASLVPGILLRCFNSADYYRARIHFGTGGAMFASITRSTTQIGASPTLPYTYAPGDEYELRAQVVGHTIRMKVWPVGTPEPSGWNHEETVAPADGQIPLGTIGLTGSGFAGVTNVNPQLRYDEFRVLSPQSFTLTRSVNTIVKPHASGAGVRVHRPAVRAL